MKKLFVLFFMALVAFPAYAQDSAERDPSIDPPIIFDGVQTDLNEFLWIKRPLIVFADAPADPRYVEQMQFLTDRLEALDARDVVVLTDTDPGARSDLRQRFHPWDVREISRVIDKLPTRQREMRENSGGS